MARTPPGSPIETAWSDAPEAILALAGSLDPGPGVRPLIGVTGPVASGKSTLARRLSPCVVPTDAYLPDYDRVPYEERDEPRHVDSARLARDLAALRSGRAVDVPVWSFHTHRREGERRIEPGPLIVCEGIHALHAGVADLYDIAVFVDAPSVLRRARWESRERTGVRGWGADAALEFFDRVAEPTFSRYEAAYRARAHIVVRNEPGRPFSAPEAPA